MHTESIYVFGLQFRRIYCYPAVEDKVRKVPWWQFTSNYIKVTQNLNSHRVNKSILQTRVTVWFILLIQLTEEEGHLLPLMLM